MTDTLPEPAVFVLAARTFQGVVAQIRDDQWALEIPDWFRTSGPSSRQTLRDIVNYHAYDDAWVPDVLAGRTMAEVGVDKHKGDLLGDDPQAAFGAIVDQAVAAAEALDDLDRVAHLSWADYPAREFLWQANSFRAFRSLDVARLIGVQVALSDELVQGLWVELAPVADEWREIGIFTPRVPVPDDAPLVLRLLGLVGRDPG